jgi:hypothetical protein
MALRRRCPAGEVVPFAKNIAKNFIETFYKEKGVALVHREGLQQKEQVSNLSFVSCRVLTSLLTIFP